MKNKLVPNEELLRISRLSREIIEVIYPQLTRQDQILLRTLIFKDRTSSFGVDLRDLTDLSSCFSWSIPGMSLRNPIAYVAKSQSLNLVERIAYRLEEIYPECKFIVEDDKDNYLIVGYKKHQK